MTEEQTNQIIPDFIEYFYEIDVDFKRPNKPEMFKFLKIYKKKTEIKKEEEPKTPRDKIIKIESNIPKWKTTDELKLYSTQFIGLTLGNAFKLAKIVNPFLPSIDDIISNKKITDKGLHGKLVETLLYGIKNNSKSESDFTGMIQSEECIPDLKVTHLLEYVNYPGEYRAKERLTCTNISRYNLANCDNFVNSCYKNKCSNILLFALEYKSIKSVEELMNIKILHIMHIDLYQVYKSYIDEDWTYITNMAKDKKKELSQKGQKYLHVHPHGSKGSEQRALGLKNKFVTEIIGKDLEKKYNKNFLIKQGNMLRIKF
ncbi:MAG: hypothetical protein CMI95_05615 [Pelagibacteraceae bacterium]|nr:hypothetical protein [Pelagibacteraceae bacterium]|tara:strand:- start:4214 stop:5158 length:945 start_codon:yes stop_codon:yes gene_type:complete